MSPTTLSILTNPRVIAVNQDPLGQQGRVVGVVQKGWDLDGGTSILLMLALSVGLDLASCSSSACVLACLYVSCVWTEVWAKNMTGGRLAVLLFNRAGILYDLGTLAILEIRPEPTLTPSPPHKFAEDQWGSEDISVTWEQLSVPSASKFQVTDLWTGNNLGVYTEYVSIIRSEQQKVLKEVMTWCSPLASIVYMCSDDTKHLRWPHTMHSSYC